jgi:hypothetical protein
MEPEGSQTTGETSAVLVRATDFSRMLERLDRMAQDLTQIKDSLPLRRRKLSKDTRRAHISCILSWYEGKCPCCREVRIIDENGSPLRGCNEEHFVNRHENALDKTWLVCWDCNQGKTNGKVAHTDVEALFRAYQVTLRKHLVEKTEGPYQMKMKDSDRVCSLRKRSARRGPAMNRE